MNQSTALESLIKSMSSDREGSASRSLEVGATTGFWSNCGAVATLKASLDRLPNPHTTEVADLIKSFFCRSDEVVAHLLSYAQLLVKGPNNHLGAPMMKTAIGGSLRILQHSTASIGLSVVDIRSLAQHKMARQHGSAIVFGGRHTILKFLTAPGAELGVWTCPGIDGNANLSKTTVCTKSGTVKIEAGQVYEYDAGKTSVVFDRARGSIVFLTAEIACSDAPVSLGFDPVSLQLKSLKATSMTSSRVEIMTALLSSMGCDNDVLVELLDHEHHYVRWHVMQCLLAKGIDEHVHCKLIRMSESDANADVRRAATRSLELLTA